MEMLLKILISVIVWVGMIYLHGFRVIHILGVGIHPAIGLIASGLNTFVTSIFDMGVDKWDKASILSKLSPIAACVFLIISVSFLRESYTTIIVASYLVGASVTYLGKVAASLL